MSSAVWSIATMKKSILFDVLGVMDIVNKADAKKTFAYDYSLLKEETVKRYDKIYKESVNQSDTLMAAFYTPVKNLGEERFTVIYEYLIDLAVDMCSFAELVNWIEKSDRSDIAYYIAAKCLSTAENEVTTDDIAKLVDESDMKVIDYFHKSFIPEKVKMSIYLMIYYYHDFVNAFIEYLNIVHKFILDLYDELFFVFHEVESMLITRLQDKKQRYQLLSSIGRRAKTEDDLKRKQIIILSLVRLEYCWMKFETKHNFYLLGLFFVQRIIHDDEFVLF